MNRSKLNNYWIITGEVNQGKTTFTQNLVKQLAFNNVECDGIITTAMLSSGEKNNYFVNSICGSRSEKLCSTNVYSNWIKYRRFYFNPIAIEFGNSILQQLAKESKNSESKVVIVDEIGHLELSNNGWYDGVVSLVQSSLRNQVWVVRKSLVDSVCDKFQIEPKQIIDVGEESASLFIGKLLSSLNIVKD